MSFMHKEILEADLKRALDEIERLESERDHYRSLYMQYMELRKINQQTIDAYKALLEVMK